MLKPEFFYIATLVLPVVSKDLAMVFDTKKEAVHFVRDLFGAHTVHMVTEYRNGVPNRVWFSHAGIIAGVEAGWNYEKNFVDCPEEVLANV